MIENSYVGCPACMSASWNRTDEAGFLAGAVVFILALLPRDDWLVGQDVAQVIVGLTDLLGLYLALTQKWTHKSISNEHRFQAVGLGWSFGDSLLRRLMPMWVTGFTPEFSIDNVIEAIRSNIVMVITDRTISVYGANQGWYRYTP